MDTTINIGSLIETKLKELRMNKSELGQKLGNISPFNTGREDMPCNLLIKVSLILEHDFFSYYSEKLPVHIQQNTISRTKDVQRIEQLEKQLADCKEKNSYLKKINELLEKKG